jgi:5-methylcytosine-specific restriction endonuclease McrA
MCSYWGSSRKRHRRIAQIARRDGFHCWLCGGTFERGNGKGRATIDHAIPKARGGTDDLFNLRLAHEQCNEERGSIAAAQPRAARTRLANLTLSMSLCGTNA